ncbi:ferric reductase transmembrane component [Suhomyces tanzawaensis NRRL Y-17324]|uniref:Ferric reductase transmembrane component n=1 Tax=Suhomyces tanzawaensis NRRL Y-17324 TaxID=984487 RepID=A0A1E4SEU8_9ASCO|nr:ferric reductase transmembrane component [Suhomyces tanzawaensis NRRL Y-17324]ODV78044.1 ferric reductase transmembrane component [Suhomyces tanzawaensis NRRL Y-17324]
MQLINVLSLLLFLGSIQAHDAKYARYGTDLTNFYACNYQVIRSATYCRARGFGCYCNNTAALSTLTGCLHYKDRLTDSLTKYFVHMCETDFKVTVTQQNITDAYELFKTSAKNVLEVPGYNRTKPINYPILFEKSVMDLYHDSYVQFLGNYDNSLYYGAGVLGYWLFVMVIAMGANFATYFFPGLVKKCTGPISNTWRKHVTLPATANRNKSEHHFFFGIHWLVPSRFETIVIVGFIAVTTFCNAHKITYVEGDPLFDLKRLTLIRYVADRSGIVATILVPLLILFAGRNNFLQWTTGWNFATFVTYHRWIGRVTFVLVVVHSVTFSVAFGNERYKEDMKETYLIWGTIGTVASGFLMVQGMLYLRRKWYEIFLLIHIILAVLFIAGSWIHVAELGYVWFFYAAVAVWVFDRAIRIARLSFFGFPKARVVLLADETLKVIIPKPSYWKSVPGGHAFIHFLRPSCFWQSHPFTFTEHAELRDKIILYCKVKGGVTHGLYQYLMTHPGMSTDIRVAVEGPYGQSSPAKKYDSAIYVAGGNGIPGIYSEVYDLARRDIKQSLKLFWVVRDYKSLLWFYEELLALKGSKISTTIYITRPDSSEIIADFEQRHPEGTTTVELENELEDKLDKGDSIKEKSDSYGSMQPSHDLSHIFFKSGRPSMNEIVEESIAESSGSTCFVTCGHPVMVDALRTAVVDNLNNKEGKSIDYFEQLQVWA